MVRTLPSGTEGLRLAVQELLRAGYRAWAPLAGIGFSQFFPVCTTTGSQHSCPAPRISIEWRESQLSDRYLIFWDEVWANEENGLLAHVLQRLLATMGHECVF